MLAAERDERGKTPVLVIDEAHLLRYEQLETIRMLTSHNLDADSPLACLLIGQPTLRRTIKLCRARSPGAAHRAEIRDAAHDQPGDQQLHQSSPQARLPALTRFSAMMRLP